ncbi:hypothetical protein ACFVJH_25180 [Streptomyces decoyicus]|uniref:hypothetical protein n=1 Tax=Streptomyces decoyicus TaxID=249567 RepID=UPI003630F76D
MPRRPGRGPPTVAAPGRIKPGYLPQLADVMEEAQLGTGEDQLQHTAELLDGPTETTARALRF